MSQITQTPNSEPMTELYNVLKTLAVVSLVILMSLFLIEKNLLNVEQEIARGFLVGCAVLMLNIIILGRSWFNVVQKGDGAALAILGTLFSFLLLGGSSFWVLFYADHFLLGYVLGFLVLPIGGLFYACRVQKREENNEEVNSLG